MTITMERTLEADVISTDSCPRLRMVNIRTEEELEVLSALDA